MNGLIKMDMRHFGTWAESYYDLQFASTPCIKNAWGDSAPLHYFGFGVVHPFLSALGPFLRDRNFLGHKFLSILSKKDKNDEKKN